MEITEILEKIIPVVAELAEMELEEIQPDAHFIKTLQINSMALLELVAELEKGFDIIIKPDVIPTLTSSQKTAEHVKKLLDG